MTDNKPANSGQLKGDDSELKETTQEAILHYADEAEVDQETLVDEITPVGVIPRPLEAGLGEFLSRPAQIYNASWIVGTTQPLRIDPLGLYLAIPSVAAKLENYHLMRFKLRIRVMINGTPFHNGRFFLGWYPLARNATGEDLNPLTENEYITIGNPLLHDVSLGRISNLPGFSMLNPANNTVVEKTLPFFYDRDFMPLPYVSTQETSFGLLMGHSTLLRVVNATATDVNISIWASLLDVDLRMPVA
jgi:hypothetical protein